MAPGTAGGRGWGCRRWSSSRPVECAPASTSISPISTSAGACEERLGLPVFVDNDATVAALAEAFDESGRPLVQNLVMFTVGTGIGGGLVLGGRVYRGATGAAAEIGHTLVGVDLSEGVPPALRVPAARDRSSRLPRVGSWITWRRRSPPTHPESALGRLAAEGRAVDGHDAVQAAKGGDAEAIGALRRPRRAARDRDRERDQHLRPRRGRDRRGSLDRGGPAAGAGDRGGPALRPARGRRAHGDPACAPRKPGRGPGRRAARRTGAGRRATRPRSPPREVEPA